MNAPHPITDLTPHRLNVTEVLAFAQCGAFDGLPRMELLDGTLYEMSPQKSPHILAKNRLTFRLQIKILQLDLPYEALCEATIVAGETSLPEPDVIICSTPIVDGFYPSASVMLAVEVSSTTLQTDLRFKKALYAGVGIPEYWVVEVEASRIHIFWHPEGEDYQEARIIQIGEPLTSATIPGLSIDSDGLI
ncbi:MAG: Uma2 family endonuclease [Sphingomonadaceae bacterium]